MVGFVNDPSSFQVNQQETNKEAVVLESPEDYIQENQESFMGDVKQEVVGMENIDSGVVGKSLEMGQDGNFKGDGGDDGFRGSRVFEKSVEMGQDDSFIGDHVGDGVVEKNLEIGQDESFRGDNGVDGFRKLDSGVVEKNLEMGQDDIFIGDKAVNGCKGTNFEDGVGKIGSLIEVEMGKVSLEGGLDECVGFGLNVGDGITEGVGSIGKDVKCEMGNGAEGFKRSVENVGVEGSEVESGKMENIVGEGEKSCEVVTEGGGIEKLSFDGKFLASGNTLSVDGVGTKSGENMSDVEDSDSESESETSGSSSSSFSSSSSSSEDDDEEEDEVEEGEMEVEEGEIRDSVEEMTAWSDEDEEFGSSKAGPIMSANEIKVLPPVPPVDVTLQPCHVTLPVGVVLSIVGAQVIVEGVEKHDPLNEGSILWITEQKSPLGIVDEIFGPVKNPYYIVRYNSENEVPSGIQQGTSVSFVQEFVNHVLNNGNLYKKGYDASGEHDEELSEEAEFSDDEKEAEYRRLQKMSKRGPKDENRKRNKNKSKRRGGQWGGDQNSSGTGLNEKVVQVPSNQNQHFRPPSPLERVVQAPSNQNQNFRPPSSNQGNCSNSSRPVQAFSGGPGSVPVFPQAPQVPGFGAPSSGVWMNGPTPNNILQLQQNQAQQPFHMPPFNGMPLQQFGTGQMMPSNFVFPGGQPGFGMGAAFTPMNQMMLGQNNFSQLHAAAANQNNFSQSQAILNMQLQHAMNMQGQHALNMQGQHAINFGQSNAAVGMQGQHAPSFVNNGEQGVLPKENQNEQNSSSQSPSATQDSIGGPQNFSNRVNFGRGRNSYRRGGGRFGGGRGRGRGRQQPR
ncbi:hypothetical protein AgCh_003707 [Apium graveolens]